MESVSDGRILHFIQELPADTKTKVLITSRKRTGGWEYPISVTELKEKEVFEFVNVKSNELKIKFPLQKKIIRQVTEVTGGFASIVWKFALVWSPVSFEPAKNRPRSPES